MAINHLSASRIGLAVMAFATVISTGAAQAQYGGYGSGGYGSGSGSGYGYGSGPSYGYGSGPSYGYGQGPSGYSPSPAHGDLYHALCEGNAANFDDWQVDRVTRYFKLDDNQKGLLAAVKEAAAKAAVAMHSPCPREVPVTWSGQLETMQTRLEAALAAVQEVRPVVDAFVGSLSDEQKARLNSIGFGYARYR